MASELHCPYCDTALSPEQPLCPACSAPNPGYDPASGQAAAPAGRPRTIEELQAFCAAKGMPLEKMRFFVGTDERSPRAFGIYREGDEFIVYKNKSDGSRAIRYRGPDEEHAVEELFLKLEEEHRKRQPSSETRSAAASEASGKKRPGRISPAVAIVICVVFFLFYHFAGRIGHTKDGYYRSGQNLYYRYGSSWYVDDGYEDWIPAESFPEENYRDYYEGDTYDASWGGSDFTESAAWEDLRDSDSDWDYDDYDYDDWDAGDTDWDSDW